MIRPGDSKLMSDRNRIAGARQVDLIGHRNPAVTVSGGAQSQRRFSRSTAALRCSHCWSRSYGL